KSTQNLEPETRNSELRTPNSKLRTPKDHIMNLLLIIMSLTITPMSATGSNQDKAKAMDALFSSYSAPGAPGASVIVIKDGKVLFKKAYGLANLEKNVAATTSTNYRLASVTKQFTAMAIMILAERQKLSYEDRLSDFFPGFPEYGKQITVRHLLNHTSG